MIVFHLIIWEIKLLKNLHQSPKVDICSIAAKWYIKIYKKSCSLSGEKIQIVNNQGFVSLSCNRWSRTMTICIYTLSRHLKEFKS